MVGSTSIRISWGRSSANRHAPSLGVVAPQSAFPQAVASGVGYGYTSAYTDPIAAYSAAQYAPAPGDPYGKTAVRNMYILCVSEYFIASFAIHQMGTRENEAYQPCTAYTPQHKE